MPDEIQLSNENPNAAVHNLEVANALAAQGTDILKPTNVGDTLDTGVALAGLRATIQKEKAAKADEIEAPTKEASDATVVTAKPDATAAPPIVKESLTTETPPPDDIFKDITLPPNIKPKSAEAFAAVKARAAQEISARETKLAELEKQLKELSETPPLAADEALQKELEEHRTFRNKLDVEADPRFKQYDKDIADTHNFIYAQLLKTGKISKENVEEIKKFGGPLKVNLEKIFEAVNDPAVRRLVESKVADEEMLLFKKEQAIKEKKDDVAGYLKEREESFSKAAFAHNDATKKEFAALTTKLDWMKDRELPKNADDAAKADVEQHNQFVKATKKDLEAALHDDSPQMRAILLAGMGQLLNLQRVHETVNKELAVNRKLLEEANAKLERFKNASKSRLPESSAPVGAKPPEPKKDDFSTPTVTGLAEAKKQILAERAAKANA